MGLDPLTTGLGLADDLVKLVYAFVNPSQHKLLDHAQHIAQDNCNEFRDYLLHDSWPAVQLALDGLRFGLNIYLTPDQRTALTAGKCQFDKLSLLGLYTRARGAMMYADMLQIVETTKPQ